MTAEVRQRAAIVEEEEDDCRLVRPELLLEPRLLSAGVLQVADREGVGLLSEVDEEEAGIGPALGAARSEADLRVRDRHSHRCDGGRCRCLHLGSALRRRGQRHGRRCSEDETAQSHDEESISLWASRAGRGLLVAAAFVVAALLGGCGGEDEAAWPLPNADLSGTRDAPGSAIDSGNAARLEARWRFPLTAAPTYAGVFASTPVGDRSTVYVQDLRSNVYALDPSTGMVRWAHRYRARSDGPNGLALDGERVYGVTDAEAFALSARTGGELWRRHLTSATEQFVDVAPVVWSGIVFVSTVGYPPGGRGAIYALDASTGSVRWKFDTIERPWRYPAEAGGGGLWYPVSVDEQGRLYAGNSNPAPWGGTPDRPNGAAFPGPARYTDSLIVLDARTGRLLWHDQVTPHDIRDYDFQATPILATVGDADVVFGAGKAGMVIAWDRGTRRRLWTRPVGRHENDVGPLPARRVTVCPGLLGGVETPMAYADGRLFVPVVDLCGWGSAVARQDVTTLDPEQGTGRLVALDGATGRTLWEKRLPSPNFGCATVSNNVVFTSSFDGTVYAFGASDGTLVWSARMRAGVNACPAVVGDLVLVGAGVPRRGARIRELVAFGPA
jgi:outer membrane protein assembly factor BamB